MKIVAIIQARMDSTRLPGKVLVNIAGVPMLQRIIDRVSVTPSVDEVIVATSDKKENDKLCEWLEGFPEVGLFRGSENDVLDRFYKCARYHEADIIIRITADDPLKDASIIEYAINYLLPRKHLDYCSNTILSTYPEGLDIEIIRFSALERAWKEATLFSEREHVTPYIWKNQNLFNIHNFVYSKNLSSWRWTVDKPIDISFMERIYTHFEGEPLVNFEKVIEYLECNPEIITINQAIPRNEGYLKSIDAELKL